MTLYNANNDFLPFTGEEIPGNLLYPDDMTAEDRVKLPTNVEQLWDVATLKSIGLWPETEILPADPVPEGQRPTGRRIELVGDNPKFVYDLEDLPEPEPEPFPELKPYQFWAVMRMTGHEQALRDWVSSLNDAGTVEEPNPNYDPVAWAYASSVIDYSLEYRRDHPLVESARQIMGVSVVELDDLWRYAATL